MNTQKKQLIIATITVLIFCAVTITGLFLLPMKSSSATSVGGDNYPELPAPAYVTAPKRVDGLVYNGRPQTLITAGQDDITYSLNQTDFTDTLPVAVDAGVYYVYYKVADDDTIYSVYSKIEKKARTVTCTMDDWIYDQTASEPAITLMENDGTTEAQITYYQNGQKLYRKPSTVGQYTVEVSVPESANYQACTATKDFAITSQIDLSFTAAIASYQNVVVSLGAQTQTVDLTYSQTTIFNSLNGTQTLTVTADGKEIFQQVINAGENQQIKVKG